MSERSHMSTYHLHKLIRFALLAASIGIAILSTSIDVYWLTYLGAAMTFVMIAVVFATTKSKPVSLDYNPHAHRRTSTLQGQSADQNAGGGDDAG